MTNSFMERRKYLVEKLAVLVSEASSEMSRSDSYGYLPVIVTYLGGIEAYLRDPADNEPASTQTLGMVLTNSYVFMESDLGNNIMDVVQEYRSLMKNAGGRIVGP